MVCRRRASSSAPRTGSKVPVRFHMPSGLFHHRSRVARALAGQPVESVVVTDLTDHPLHHFTELAVRQVRRRSSQQSPLCSDPVELGRRQAGGGFGDRVDTVTGGIPVGERGPQFGDVIAGLLAGPDPGRFRQRRPGCCGDLVLGEDPRRGRGQLVQPGQHLDFAGIQQAAPTADLGQLTTTGVDIDQRCPTDHVSQHRQIHGLIMNQGCHTVPGSDSAPRGQCGKRSATPRSGLVDDRPNARDVAGGHDGDCASGVDEEQAVARW